MSKLFIVGDSNVSYFHAFFLKNLAGTDFDLKNFIEYQNEAWKDSNKKLGYEKINYKDDSIFFLWNFGMPSSRFNYKFLLENLHRAGEHKNVYDSKIVLIFGTNDLRHTVYDFKKAKLRVEQYVKKVYETSLFFNSEIYVCSVFSNDPEIEEKTKKFFNKMLNLECIKTKKIKYIEIEKALNNQKESEIWDIGGHLTEDDTLLAMQEIIKNIF